MSYFSKHDYYWLNSIAVKAATQKRFYNLSTKG